MNWLVPLVLVGWIPVGLALFAWLPVRKAILSALLLAWLFLPQAGYPLPGFPDYTRITATCVVIICGVLFFDGQRLLTYRPTWHDIPLAVFCAGGLATSVSNGLGWYDGLSVVFGLTVAWAVPYVIGKVYFADEKGGRMLSLALFVGGLVYTDER